MTVDDGYITMSGTQKKVEEDVTVPVNEDYLFDVHIRKRELASAYWEGPVYSVLRGTWFKDGELYHDILRDSVNNELIMAGKRVAV